jgi:hypothetical protein
MKVTLKLTDIITSSIKIIITDYIIIFPYLILSLLLAIISPKGIETLNSNPEKAVPFVNFIFIAYIFGLIIQGITIQIAYDNLSNNLLDIGKSIKIVLKSFPRLIASSFTMLLFFLFLIQIMVHISTLLHSFAFILVFPFVIIFLLLILAMEFLPIFIIIEKEPISNSILKSINFIKKYFFDLILYSLLLLFCTFLSLTFAQTLHDNAIIRNIFLPLIQGFLGAFVIISTVVVYSKLKRNE